MPTLNPSHVTAPFLVATLTLAGIAAPLGAQQGIFVNGEPVTQDDFVQELGRLGLPMTVQVPDGEYWYDRVSGLWGMRGGPTAGQMPPGLALGGELRADASGAPGTMIFINGRELHPSEVLYLQRLVGYTVPGRYWMNAMGVGGYEGGPAFFDLLTLARQQAGGDGYTRRGLFGSTGSDGDCSYYMTPGGSSVMTGNC